MTHYGTNDVNRVDYERVVGYAAGRGISVRDAIHEIITWPRWGWPHGWPGRLDGKAPSLKPPDPGDGQPAEAIYDDDLGRIRKFADEKRGLSFERAFHILTRRPFSGPLVSGSPWNSVDSGSFEDGSSDEHPDPEEMEHEALINALESGEYEDLSFEEMEGLWAETYVLLLHARRH
jgi:hypothetical protein